MAEPRPAGQRLIIAYKGARALLSIAAALALFFGTRDGGTQSLIEWALATRQRIGHHVWIEAARLVLAGASHLAAVGVALAADGALAAFEGFALARGYTWSDWFVVGTTLTPVPWELFELARHPRPARFLLLLINLATVAYLAARARALSGRRR
jgi:uncharacterized membrane protein (DUF2068 family)